MPDVGNAQAAVILRYLIDQALQLADQIDEPFVGIGLSQALDGLDASEQSQGSSASAYAPQSNH